MKSKVTKALMTGLFWLITLGSVWAVQCTVWGWGTDGFLTVVRSCTWWTHQNCCDYTAGVAYCQTDYYMDGEYYGSSGYYTEISRAQEAMGCGFTITV